MHVEVGEYIRADGCLTKAQISSSRHTQETGGWLTEMLLEITLLEMDYIVPL